MPTFESNTHIATPAPRTAVPPPIQLENLTHDYGTRVALDHLTFDVRPAEIFGLLGPNGSGKTTLFRILSTLMVPSAGHARIAGFDVAHQPQQVRQHTGIVFQARSIDLKLTVAENLMHQGHLYGLGGAILKSRITEMLRRVALSDRANDRVENLSGGMQRRVELAKGLIHSPQVLLLDEPSTGLDPGARRDLWQYLAELRDEHGVAVLVTTHLMEEAEHCNRLAVLSEGKLVALGTPAELKAEIGGDVVVLGAADEYRAQQLALRVSERFAILTNVVGAAVRIECERGHRFVAEAAEAFPGEIVTIAVAKPTLEDVFIQRTGHRFWTEANPDNPQIATPANRAAATSPRRKGN